MGPPSMVPKFWRVLAIILGIILLAIILIGLIWGYRWLCDQLYPPEDATAQPAVASLQTSTSELQVAPADGVAPRRKFQLYAWYRDAANNVVSGRFDPMKWGWNPDNPPNTADNGTITVASFPAAGSQDLAVRAEHASNTSLFDEVALKLWHATADATTYDGGSDVVVAKHGLGTVPSVVLLEPSSAGKCKWGGLTTFVGAAAVGEQAETPCSIALFSGDHAMVFQKPTTADGWTAPKATVSLATQPVLKVPVTVFIAVTARTASALSGIPLSNTDQLTRDVAKAAEAQARVDVDWVNSIFEANRVGLTIDATYVPILPTVTDLPAKVGADPFSCVAPRNLAADPETAGMIDESKISVYYVDWIDYPSDPLHEGSRGVYCAYWYNGTPAPVVFISYTRHSSSTLAHELGHALGLGEAEDHLGAVNAMNNIALDGPFGASARSQFTLGQVFHMNVNQESWINTGVRTDPVRTCAVSDPCTPLDLNEQ